MPAWNKVIEGIITRLNQHHTRHEYGGADVISLAGLTVAGEDISYTLEEVATATTLTADHYLVVVDASSSNITITLPAATSHTNRIYIIKKIDSLNHTVKIDANGTEKIDGEETITLNLQYSYVTIICDGDEWFIIGGEYVKMEDKIQMLIEEAQDTNKNLSYIERHLEEITNLELKEETDEWSN